MIIDRLFRRRSRLRRIPYGMFKLDDYGLAAKNARVLERIYHKGQDFAWDGREVLASLIEEHGPPTLPEDTKRALGRPFSVIMWGELAAWQISAELADELEPLEAKMAATSQAFDEARHFYVMHDYLQALGALPDEIDWGARRLLESVMNANHLAKKLVGMQLMIEPVALTLFHLVKKLNIEPVLTGLMPYYERDEARHVALGIHYLPALLSQMSNAERLSFFLYQVRLIAYEVWSGRGLAKDLKLLGIEPKELLDVGNAKQSAVAEQMWKEMSGGKSSRPDMPGRVLQRYADFIAVLALADEIPMMERLRRAKRALMEGLEVNADISLDPEVTDDQVPLMRAMAASAS